MIRYQPEVDGLRAVAVIPVVLFHAGLPWFDGGFVGVDVFFVISGYLITSIILKEIVAGKFSLIRFYERRSRRIMPALFFVTLCTFFAACVWFPPSKLFDYSKSLVALSFFGSNFYFLKSISYFSPNADTAPLLHTWSLAVEEQFYIFFPLMLSIAMRRWSKYSRALVWIAAAASLIACVLLTTRSQDVAYFLAPFRAWELLMGSLLAIHSERLAAVGRDIRLRQIMSSIGLALVAWSVFFFDRKTVFPGLSAIIPTLGTAMIIAFSGEDTAIGRVLSRPFFVRIGLISYGIYLWHQPVFAFARWRSLSGNPPEWVFVILSGLSVFLAWLTYRLVEIPFKDRARISVRRVFQFTGAFIVFGAIAGAIGILADGIPVRLGSDVVEADSLRRHRGYLEMSFCQDIDAAGDFSGCLKGAPGRRPSFVLIGDSHAASLVRELSKMFAGRGVSFVSFAKPACSLNFYLSELLEKFPSAPQRTGYAECRQRNGSIQKFIEASDIENFVVFARKDDPNFPQMTPQRALEFDLFVRSIQDILSRGKRVYLIHPVPAYSESVSEYRTRNLMFARGSLPPLSQPADDYFLRNRYFREKLRDFQHPNLVHVTTDQLFCGPSATGRCITEDGSGALYFDSNHLSDGGAGLVVGELARRLR